MKALLLSLSKILAGKSYRQSLLVSGGTVFNSLLGLIFYVVVGRNLSVSDFGYFSFLLAIGILAADLGDWGINPAIVKFGPAGLSEVLSLGVLQRVLAGTVIFFVAAAGQLFLARNFYFSAVVAMSLLGLYLVTQSFLAKQHYLAYIGTNVLGNITRLAMVVILVTGGVMTSFSSLISFAAANVLALFFGIFLLRSLEPELKLEFSTWRQTFEQIKSFSSWTGSSFVLAALASKLDTLAVFSMGGSYQAGLYSSGQKLASVLPQVSTSLDSVFAPKLSQDKGHFKDYFLISVVVSFFLLILIPFSPTVILIFKAQYLAATSTLQVLLLGMAFFILTGPFSATVLYHHGRSKIYFFNSVGQILLSLIFYFLLIPHFGAVGAAWTFVITSLVGLIYNVGAFNFLRQRD